MNKGNKGNLSCLKLYQLGKSLFILLLATTFLIFQAQPCVEKYLKKEVAFSIYTEPDNKHCEKNQTIAEILDCIERETYSLRETVEGVQRGLNINNSLEMRERIMQQKNWLSDVTSTGYGKCHTLKVPFKLRAHMVDDGVAMGLFPNKSYRIVLHDPKLFLQASNPLVFPRIAKEYVNVKSNYMEWFYIKAREYRLMNREGNKCNPDPDYDLMACVKNNQAKQVGCRPGWDQRTNKKFPLCTTVNEMESHEDLDYLILNEERKIVIKKTGCHFPCTYREYFVVDEPQVMKPGGNIFLFGYNFVSTEVEVYREDYMYPFLSFLSEFGGSLGLFLGLSFVTVIDLIDVIVFRFKNLFGLTI